MDRFNRLRFHFAVWQGHSQEESEQINVISFQHYIALSMVFQKEIPQTTPDPCVVLNSAPALVFRIRTRIIAVDIRIGYNNMSDMVGRAVEPVGGSPDILMRSLNS